MAHFITLSDEMILLRIALLLLLACHVDVVVEGFLAIPRRPVSSLHHSREVMHPKGVYTDDEGIESYDSFGFSPQLRVNGFTVPTHVVFGTNAMEHGVNLLEEISREALVVHGWNAARLDTLLWELEPRGFQLDFLSISSPTPTFEDVADIVHALESSKMRIVIAVGGGCIIDAVKLAATVMSVGLYLCLPWLYVAFISESVIMMFSVVMGTSLYLIAGHLLGLTRAFLVSLKEQRA